MRALLLLTFLAAACATAEPCHDVAPRTRFTVSGWSMARPSRLLVVLHNARGWPLEATLDCTACDPGLRDRVTLGPHEHLPIQLRSAPEGCACRLEHDELYAVLP